MNTAGSDTPPPGAGFTTATLTVPEDATSLAAIAAVSCVALTKVVVLGVPFHCRLEPATNPVPFTVSEKSAPPAVMELGVKDAIVGTGFSAAMMLSVVESDIEPELAVMVVLPSAFAVARPEASIEATDGLDEDQLIVTPLAAVPSVIVPAALNCSGSPTFADGFLGLMVMEASAGAATVKVVEAETEPQLTVIVVLPWPFVVITPFSTVATEVLEDVHVRVRPVAVLPSVIVPVTLIVCPRPSATEGLLGESDSEARIDWPTVMITAPCTVPEVAVIVTVPGFFVVTKPFLSTVATLESEELQVTFVTG